MKIYKFGGASVKDAASVKNISGILKREQAKDLIVVISAMGKTTNALEKVWKSYINSSVELNQSVQEVKDFHFNMLENLFPDKSAAYKNIYDEVSNVFVELEWILEEEPSDDKDFIYDQIVSLGELLSTKIVTAYLSYDQIPCVWLDARSYIATDNTYREGTVDWAKTIEAMKAIPNIASSAIIITQGFIGCTSENYTTTLGREGSDYSAAIFAHCLDAESMTIWKDVPGVLTADPKLFSDAHKIAELPYAEALEMTFYGATVIHPKTIKPLQNKSIPLYVKAFSDPSAEGTVIGKVDLVRFTEPSIIVKKNQLLLSISTKDFSFITEHNLAELLRRMSEHHIKMNVLQHSAMTVSCCIDNEEDKSLQFIKAISTQFKVLYNDSLELVTVRHYNEKIIQSLQENKTLILEQRSRNTIQMVLKSN